MQICGSSKTDESSHSGAQKNHKKTPNLELESTTMFEQSYSNISWLLLEKKWDEFTIFKG